MHAPLAFTESRLPSSDSRSLSLVPATTAEKQDCWRINAEAWRGALDIPSYLQREQHLQNQEQNRDGGIVYWILIDTTLESDNASRSDVQNGFSCRDNRKDHTSATNCTKAQPRHILASCESLRKRALVSRGGIYEEVTVWGIGSVFVREEYRGRGYAGRMMDELRMRLEGWGQEGGSKTAFTVLFSDIGKAFYANHGWHPFPSLHISLPSLQPSSTSNPETFSFPESCPLTSAALPHLCDLDIAAIQNTLSKCSTPTNDSTIAILPTAPTMAWHHARESFFYKATKPCSSPPFVKGAMCDYIIPSPSGEGEEKKKVWIIWTRSWGQKPGEEGVLQVLRIGGTEEEHPSDVANTFGTTNGDSNYGKADDKNIKALVAILQAAQLEAHASGLDRVEIWNPGKSIIQAAKLALELEPGEEVLVEEREKRSLPCLMWYGDGAEDREGWKTVRWIANEKFAWC